MVAIPRAVHPEDVKGRLIKFPVMIYTLFVMFPRTRTSNSEHLCANKYELREDLHSPPWSVFAFSHVSMLFLYKNALKKLYYHR